MTKSRSTLQATKLRIVTFVGLHSSDVHKPGVEEFIFKRLKVPEIAFVMSRILKQDSKNIDRIVGHIARFSGSVEMDAARLWIMEIYSGHAFYVWRGNSN